MCEINIVGVITGLVLLLFLTGITVSGFKRFTKSEGLVLMCISLSIIVIYTFITNWVYKFLEVICDITLKVQRIQVIGLSSILANKLQPYLLALLIITITTVVMTEIKSNR